MGRLQVADQPVHFRAVPANEADHWMVYGTDPEGMPLRSLDQPRAASQLPDARSETTEQEEFDLQRRLAEQFLTAAETKQVASRRLQTADQLDPIDSHLQSTSAVDAARLVWMVLRLHWLDQANRRKEQLPQVVESAQAVVTWVRDQGRPKDERARQLLLDTQIDALYRQGRALGYMELPDVVARHPIADPEQHERAFQSVFDQLQQLVDTKSPRYCLLHIRQDRRQSRYALALELLNHHIQHSPPSYWYYQKRRDVYQSLGWDLAYEFEARRLAILYPR